MHGRADLLRELLAWIEASSLAIGQVPCIRFLGDIVDRGPDSRAAMDMVAGTLERWPASRLILGNHDDCLLAMLSGRAGSEASHCAWLDQGGRETLLSYGVDPEDREGARALILGRHPRHAAILSEAPTIEIMERFVIVHAGIDPMRPLRDQRRADCLNIRGPFLDHVGRLDHVVVHGHTPQRPPQPTVTENRISVDTGAVTSGVLSVAVIDLARESLRFASAIEGGGVAEVEPILLDRGLGTAVDDLRP